MAEMNDILRFTYFKQIISFVDNIPYFLNLFIVNLKSYFLLERLLPNLGLLLNQILLSLNVSCFQFGSIIKGNLKQNLIEQREQK